jgi:hypothetical protein
VFRLVVAAGLVAGATFGPAACGGSIEGAGSRSRQALGSAARPGAVVIDRVHVLAFGVLPNGQGYWISARSHAPQGKAAVELDAELEPAAGTRDSTSEAFGSAGGGTLKRSYTHGPLAVGALVACAHRPVTLLIGLLRAPSDSAVLRYRGGSRAMSRVAIPRDLRSGGDLEYAYTSRPVTVVVRSGSGAIVETVAIPGGRAGSRCDARAAG